MYFVFVFVLCLSTHVFRGARAYVCAATRSGNCGTSSCGTQTALETSPWSTTTRMMHVTARHLCRAPHCSRVSCFVPIVRLRLIVIPPPPCQSSLLVISAGRFAGCATRDQQHSLSVSSACCSSSSLSVSSACCSSSSLSVFSACYSSSSISVFSAARRSSSRCSAAAS